VDDGVVSAFAPIPSHLLDGTMGQPFEVGACTDACLGAPRATVAEAPPGVDVDALGVLGMPSADAPRAYPSASGPRSALAGGIPPPVIGREELAELVRDSSPHAGGPARPGQTLRGGEVGAYGALPTNLLSTAETSPSAALRVQKLPATGRE
jgi:hypothetical protein